MGILFDGTNHPSAQQVIDAGCIGCLMYGGTPQYGKNFTPGQYHDYQSRGLLTLFVFEVAANDMAGGASAGAAHAHALMADLRAGGVSTSEPVGPTVDEHVTAANIGLVVQYQTGFYRAVKSAGWAGPVGVYGFGEVLTACHDAGVADWYWGAGSRSAMPPYTNIWQDNTGTIQIGGSADDRDWVLIPLPGGDMPLTPADANTVWSADVWVHFAAGAPEAAYAVQLGYKPNPDGSVDIQNSTAGGWLAVAALRVAMIETQVAAITGALTTEQAAILAAVAGADTDTKAGIAQLVAAVSGVDADVKTGVSPISDAQVLAIETALAAALGVDLAHITVTVGTKPAGGTA